MVNHVLDNQPLDQGLPSPLRSATLSLFGDVSLEFKGYLLKASRLRLSQTESTPLPLTSSLKTVYKEKRTECPDWQAQTETVEYVLQQIDKYVYLSENTF